MTKLDITGCNNLGKNQEKAMICEKGGMIDAFLTTSNGNKSITIGILFKEQRVNLPRGY